MKIKFDGYGYSGEHKSRLIEFEIDKKLIDCEIYLEFKKECGKKLVTKPLEIILDTENDRGVGSYWLGNELLDNVGYLKMQLVAKGSEYIEKSSIYSYYVSESINASETINSEFEDVITDLEKKKADGIEYSEGTLKLTAKGLVIGEVEISGGGVSDYNNLSNQPLKVITSLDSNNPVNLRSLESGLYRLHGYFKPYESYTGAFTVPAPLFAAVVNNGSVTYMQLYFAYNNMIQYFELTDEAFTNTNVMLNTLVTKITELEEKVAKIGG